MKIINSIFKTFVLSLLLIAQVHFAYAQSAALLPNATQVFLDNNGKPLSSGTINFYIPGTTTPKMVWQDASQTTPWTQPITLNAAGRPPTDKGIYGNGTYRQIVKDRNNNIIWDQPTSATGTGGGAGTSVGDGNSVGTILQWGGMIAPNQYQFSYGQALSRTTYPELYQAVTQLSDVTCVGGNTSLTGLSDTSNIPIGANVEGNCIAPGSTVTSKTLTTVTLSIAAVISVTTSARFFPYGNGDGSTTFNVPDLRGKVLAGRTNMGGVTSSNLTSTYFGSNPDAVGANGGTQSATLTLPNLPSFTPQGRITITDPGHVHTSSTPTTSSGATGTGGNSQVTGFTSTASALTGITAAFTSAAIGGTYVAASATVATGGSGYTNGLQTATVSGGTCTTQPQFTVTVSAGVVTNPVLLTAGSCSLPPINAVSLTISGGGSGATLNVTYTNTTTSFSIVQPTLTLNYIIKVTPDTSVSGLFGVASIGGMQGVIACGSGLTCAGNTISAVIPSYPTQAANTVLANTTAATAAPIANALPSCSTASSALTYTTNTGFGCNTIAGSGTVNSGTINQLAYYAATGTAVSGNANVTVSSAALRLGVAGSALGTLLLSGNTSGTVTLSSQAAAGTPTITFGTSSGTPAVTASAPLAISTSTGNISITGAAGQILAGATPAFTATPTLGASGTLGSITMGNATSGTVTLQPTTGALGTVTNSLPAITATLTANIAAGTAALGTSAISSAACASVVTVAATGVLTTDVVTASFNGDPTAVTGYVPLTTGMLAIIAYPTSGNVNFKVCNNTASSITPGAITLNWKVVR